MNSKKLARQQKAYLRHVQNYESALEAIAGCKEKIEHFICKDDCDKCDKFSWIKNDIKGIEELESKGVHISLDRQIYFNKEIK